MNQFLNQRLELWGEKLISFVQNQHRAMLKNANALLSKIQYPFQPWSRRAWWSSTVLIWANGTCSLL
ncbi:unnamed protein product [Lathyrus oleraceus]